VVEEGEGEARLRAAEAGVLRPEAAVGEVALHQGEVEAEAVHRQVAAGAAARLRAVAAEEAVLHQGEVEEERYRTILST